MAEIRQIKRVPYFHCLPLNNMKNKETKEVTEKFKCSGTACK